MNHSFALGKLNIGLLAVLGAFCLLVVQTDRTPAATGGVNITPPKTSGKVPAVNGARFGTRTLREGMAGPDVKVLQGIVRSKRLLANSPLTGNFDRPTTSAVRRFQSSIELGSNGVVNRTTARAMVSSLRTSEASWYGPGLYGNGTACGKVTLRPNTIGLANKNLPCGTKVLIGYRGRYVIAPVIDRGPYIPGRTWDLTAAAAEAIGLTSAGIGRVRHAIISRGD